MSIEYSSDQILDKMKIIMEICKENEYLYKNSKNEMMVKIRESDPIFYGRYYRVCKSIVFENIDELLVMIDKKRKIEDKEATLDDEDKKISNVYNTKYINPILNKKELVEEREKKIAEKK